MPKPLNLLLIEDSEDDELLLLRALKKADYAVVHQRVEDIVGLRDALTQTHWDIIISDYAMPHFSGLEALKIVRDLGIHLPFIMVSGEIGEELAVRIIKAGANDYVMKHNLTRLTTAIDRAIQEVEERNARKIAEAQVHQLSRALAQSQSLVLITDSNGIIEYANPTYLQMTGYDHDDLIGKDWAIHKQHHSQTPVSTLLKLAEEDSKWRGELLSLRKDGSEFWVAMTISAVYDNQGNVSQFLIVKEDISERKRLESELQRYTEQLEQMVEERTKQLRSAKEQMEAILNNSSDGIVLALSTGDIQTRNPAFDKLFGGMVKNSIEELLHFIPNEAQMSQIADSLLSTVQERNTGRTQISVDVTGEPMDLDVSLSPVPLENNQYDGVVLSMRDITPLREVERYKERFVANAAHDLANPISALKMHLFMLRARPERLNETLDVLERQTNRLEMLVSELRTLSEIDRGMIQLKKQSVNINDLVRSVITAHEPIATEKQQTLKFKPNHNLPPLNLDYDKFERVVVNLVANAISYTPKGGEVLVQTFRDSDTISFTVKDTGIGIPADKLANVFDRFFRTDEAQMANANGTGLGLAIVKEMVEAHKGHISVQSIKDEGSIFMVTLPTI